MTKPSDILKAEIERTKAELKQKVEALESELREEVSDAKETVQGAIHGVQSVFEGVSISHQVQKRPLVMLGGSVLSGILVSRWWVTSGRSPRLLSPGQPRESFLGKVADQFPDEVQMVKTMAINQLVNFVVNKAKAFEERKKTESDEIE